MKKKPNTEIIDCFVDADWAGDVTDRKSTSGFMIRTFGNVIFWKSKKQNTVTKASTFAEYVSLSEAVTELLFIRELLNFFDVELNLPIKIHEDNSGAVIIAKYGNLTKNSKYIEVHYHYVNENYSKGVIDIIKIDSKGNPADIFTKSLGRIKFEKFRQILNLV